MKGKSRIQSYYCLTTELDENGLPPLKDDGGVSVAESSICEVRNNDTNLVVNLFTLDGGVWCEY